MNYTWMCCLVAGVTLAQAQPYTSPAATTMVEFGGKQIRISYHSPSMHGRQIFGGLVPYGQVWRAGANQATLLHTDLDLTIGSLAVPKGDYSIYILPEENQWTLIINTQTGQWGIKMGGATTEDPAKDLGRVVMKLSKPAAPVDTFAITLTKDGNQGSLAMAWENTVATVAFTAK
ncbi:MAG: DUF2911 domain-containing protein [Bryobacteraceae bacterium]|jgi:hypothetical protein